MSKEILMVVDAIANEKGIGKAIVFEAIELALATATRRRYREEVDIRVSIDTKTGDYQTYRRWLVVADDEPLEMPEQQLSYSQAQQKNSELTVGDYYEELIPSEDFGRIAAQAAKQVIVQKVREAERMQVVKDYRNRVDEILTGTIKKVIRDGFIIDLGNNAEALLSRDETIPKDNFRLNDRVRAVLYEVLNEGRGPHLLLSRTRPMMLEQLFRIEVPEIAEQLITIKGVARDPGSRAKIAVKTNDGRIDPVGACVGMRGARVQAVSNELNGERADIVLWDDDPVQLVINVMAPAEISSIVMDEDTHTMDIAVAESQLAQAIGRSGQNIRLASELTGWTLNVMTEQEASTKQQVEQSSLVHLFMDKLEVDEDLSKVLVEEGFSSVEEIAYVPLQEMLNIEGFDEDIVSELRKRAKDVLLNMALSSEEHVAMKPPSVDLIELEGMDSHLAYLLAQHNITDRETLAEQAVDDLLAIEGMDAERAAKLIMAARAHWFTEDIEDEDSNPAS
jgi:N utilization substance protein A